MSADGERAHTEGKASVRMFRDVEMGAVLAGDFSPRGTVAPQVAVRLALTKPLDPRSRLDIRLVEGTALPSRAEVSVKLRF